MAVQGEILRGVVSYLISNASVAQNIFYWEVQDEDNSDAATLAAIETWVTAEWGTTWDNIADDNSVMFLLELDVISGLGLVTRNIGQEIVSVQGLSTDDVLPAGVAGFIQASTERAKSLGRKYVPGLTGIEVDEGAFSAALLATLLLLGADWLTVLDVGATGHLVPGVLSRVTAGFLEFDGSIYSTDIPAYQRRRKPNVGS